MKFNNYVATENQGFSVSFKLPAGTSKIQKFKESASVKMCCIFILVMYNYSFSFLSKGIIPVCGTRCRSTIYFVYSHSCPITFGARCDRLPCRFVQNHLLHVVANDCDVEVALRLLDDDIDNGDSCGLDCICIDDDCSYSCEGM